MLPALQLPVRCSTQYCRPPVTMDGECAPRTFERPCWHGRHGGTRTLHELAPAGRLRAQHSVCCRARVLAAVALDPVVVDANDLVVHDVVDT